MDINITKNWDEDFLYENGNYYNLCCVCNEQFIGHKRRVLCKECYINHQKLSEITKNENGINQHI